ncbi:multicopper oxidase family protein [Pseudomonadota bacterium]
MNRREVLKFGLVGGTYGVLNPKGGLAQESGLVYPDGHRPSIEASPSPPVTPFKDPLRVMPVAKPIFENQLSPPPDPDRHQRYREFRPKKFYTETYSEFVQRYHSDGPYAGGTWNWGVQGSQQSLKQSPAVTYHANYEEPIFIRRINNLPSVGTGKLRFPLPSISIHLHNFHTASESDGIPQDYFDPGEFWDHHYAMHRAGGDENETLTTLWYHDHRLDFTAPNIYAGNAGLFLCFDHRDSNNERDRGTQAWRLPSGNYDVPLIFHDLQFDKYGQLVWDFFNPNPIPHLDASGNQLSSDSGLPMWRPNEMYTVNGMIGDRFTVNRVIQPHHKVEPRKYRFRLLNGGPARFLEFYLRDNYGNNPKFVVLSTDGNFLPEPIISDAVNITPAQRHDVIINFSGYKPGDTISLINHLESRIDGAGPTGRYLDPGDEWMQFQVIASKSHEKDPSRIPDFFRPLPNISLKEAVRERTWVFDYDNGMWTINGMLMDPNRVDAAVEIGSAEIWTLRNAGNAWSHPIHIHFEEHRIIEKNGIAIVENDLHHGRKDVLQLGPNDEVKIYMRWRDFLGKHVMHCHNVIHEDHAMMIRWDIVQRGQGY